MKLHELQIKLYHGQIGKGCQTFKHFQDQWVKGEIYPKLKEIEVAYVEIEMPAHAEIHVIYKNKETIFKCEGLRLDLLDVFLRKQIEL